MLASRREFLLVAASSMLVNLRALAHISNEDTDRIRVLLADWVDRKRQCLGVCVGVVTREGHRTESYGVLGLNDRRPVTADTIFGIASLTKVFTGLLLTDAIVRKEVTLQDPVRIHLPSDAILPKYQEREITLRDLATQTSGLPHEIPRYAEAADSIGNDPNVPLFEFLAGHELTRPIGEQWGYSNINYALIGLALVHRTRRSYEQLVRERIAVPLDMRSTFVALPPEMKARRASPHLDVNTPAPEWNKPWSLGSGSLQSTARDLSLFIASASGQRDGPLTVAFKEMLKTVHPAPFLQGEQAIGWAIDRSDGSSRVYFGGRAPGFTSSMMFDPSTQRGVVALSNTSLMVEDLAREIFRPSSTKAEAELQEFAPPDPDPALDR